jgi:hypothetical protein
VERGFRPSLELLEARIVPSFSAPVFYNTGESPGGLAVGDLTRDGNLDVVVANGGSNFSSLFRGNGDGTFHPAVNIDVGRAQSFVAVADLTGNGIPDLVFVTAGNTVTTLLGDGAGGFTVRGTFSVGAQGLTRFAVGDLTGNGIPDLAVPDAVGGGTNGVSVLLGNGDGTFRPPVRYILGSGYPYAAAIGDLNGDGIPDLAVADALNGQVKRLLGNGDGTFQNPVSYAASGSSTDVQLGDFNEDGILDIVTANQGTVSYLRGYGNGTFYNPVTYNAGPGAYSVAVADVNHDGHLDLITANPNNETVSVLLGNGDGTFQSAVQYAAGPYPGSSPHWVAAGDFSEDGYPDLAVTNSRANVVGILINQPEADHLQLDAPATSVAGAPFDVTVTALNPLDHTDPNYRGTVHFSSTDGSASLHQNYMFTAAVQGQHSFTVTLRTAGSQTVTLNDTVHTTIRGSAVVAVTPAAASQLAVTGFPSPVTAGTVHTFTVAAQDPYGNTAPDFTGTVQFSSSDDQAIVPEDYTFSAADQGIRVFGAVLRTAGFQSLTATDADDPSITGTQAGILVNAAAFDHLFLSAPDSALAGMPFPLTVIAQDAFNNTVTGYGGTIHLDTSDPLAVFPPDYTFGADDAGAHTFTITLGTPGEQTISATDIDSGISGNIVVQVLDPPVPRPVNSPVGPRVYQLIIADLNTADLPDLGLGPWRLRRHTVSA